VDVGDLAQLLPGIASIITALGGVWIGLRALKTGSRRERRTAAQHVIDRAIGTDDEGDEQEDRHDARAELLKALRDLADEEGNDG
jgi:hypothetical protein